MSMLEGENHAGGCYGMSRRMLLGGLTGIVFSTQSVQGALVTAQIPSEPVSQLRLLIKMMASLATAAVPWFYTGRIYAVRAGTAPLHLYNFEGSEMYWMRPIGTNSWSMAVSTLTFYRDRESGAYLDSFDNPLTGKTVSTTANVLRSKAGQSAVYSPKSLAVLGESQPVTMEVHRNGEVIWLTTSRTNPHAPPPSMEVNTLFCSARDADDGRRSSARSTFSSVSLSHWSKWLDVGDLDGHLLWHAAGRKLGSIDELPDDYRHRAAGLETEHFSNPDPVSTTAVVHHR